MKIFLYLSLMLPALLPAACLPLDGDRILGRDLAHAEPKFSALPATIQLGYGPLPGAPRVFTVVELQRIAGANGMKVPDLKEVCFEIPMHAPSEAEFVGAMRNSLPHEATVRLVDMGRDMIPAGRTEFPLSGLEPPAAGNDGAQLWRGLVQYTDTRRIAIWARVAIAVTYTAVVAGKDLTAETPIDDAALQIVTKTGALKRDPIATQIEEVAGRVVRQPLRAGAEIPLSLLDDPPAVRRGDLVRVEVQSGQAVLRFDAVAQTTARAGEMIDLRNPITGKTFRARAEAGSRAVILVGKGPA